MPGRDEFIAAAIDESPLNRGLRGTDWLAFPGNLAIVRDQDVTLFDYEGAGTYQIHILYSSSGREAIRSAREAIEHMLNTHANVIFGMVPCFQKHVKLIARWVGMAFVGIRPTRHGPCELFVVSKAMLERPVK